MAILGARPIGFSSFPSSTSYLSSSSSSRLASSSLSSTLSMVVLVRKSIISRECVTCSALQESSTPTAAKPKAAAKALPELKTILETEDDITEIDLTFKHNKLEGSFLKDCCPYSFWAFFPDGVLTGITIWANWKPSIIFHYCNNDVNISPICTGPKGFSLSSYGSGASTVEPFLVDERKITARHVVFWVEKRLAAQGITPVWKE
ncbi:hypothetical protein GQ457_06G027770 [Hibiscus cannabinus]